MIAAIYARKSTSQDDVAEDAKSVTRQIGGARAFIAAKGWTLDEQHVYTDDGVSGALFANRAEFQRMMRDAAAGAFGAVVFYDLDRFGRNARQTMLALNTLADLGVTIWDYSTGQAVDLDSFEGEMMTFMKARFAQQYRDQVRKHTRDAMRQKAEAGYVTGGKVFGYNNVRVAKGQTTRVPNEAEATVVRDIYERFAAGGGLRTIALALNNGGALSPRAQQGRPNGWSSSSVRAVLERSLYRGEVVFGRTASAYGRELGKHSAREKGQIPRPEDTWTRRDVPALRLISADLTARVDARRAHWKQRVVAAKAKGRAPLAKPNILAIVQKHHASQLAKAELTAVGTLEAIRRQVYADVRCLFDARGNLRPIKALSEAEASLIAGYEVIIKNAAAGDGHQDTVHKIRLRTDQVHFVELAAKHFGMLVDKLEVSEADMSALDAGRQANAEARRLREAAKAAQRGDR